MRIHLIAKANTVAPAMADEENVPLSVDPSDGGLRVHVENGGVGGGGGTEYTEGNVDATITGTAVMWEDTSDTLRAVSAAKPLPVNVVAGSGSNPAAGSTGAAVPSSADLQGIDVAGTLRAAKGFDLDSGAGAEYVQGASLRKSASGGSVEIGTLADPIRTDPTGTTTQPISGTVTANVGTTGGLALDATLTGGAQKTKLVDSGGTNVASVSAAGAVKVDGSAVTQPVSGTVTANLAAGTNNIGDVDVLTLPSLPAGNNNIGDVDVASLPAIPTGSNVIGKVGIDQTTPGTTNAVQDIPATSGGLSKYHAVSAASTNAANIKASAGQVYAITAFNLNASPRYLKFHNTSGSPTAGSGVTDTFLIPGNTAGAGLVLNIDKGIAFSAGIGVTITGGIADSDTTAISASEVVVNIYYK